MTRDANFKSTIRAIKLRAPLKFDGRLDDEVYGEFPGFGGMLQVSPQYNQPSTEKTEIWVMFDGDNIYVAAKLLRQRAAREVDRQRAAPRHQPDAAERSLRRRLRHLLRSPQRVHVLRQSARRLRRLLRGRRGRAEHRLEPGVGREDRPLRRRLDARDAVPVQVAALHLGRRPGLGHPVPPLDPPQERVDLLDAGAAEHGGPAGAQSRLVVRHGGRPRPAAGEPQPRAQAVRARQDVDRSADRTRRSRTTRTATSAATSSTASPRTSPPTSPSTPTSRRSRSTSSRST